MKILIVGLVFTYLLSFEARARERPEEFLESETPTLENGELEFKEKRRKISLPRTRPKKSVRDSSGDVVPSRESTLSKETGVTSQIKEPPLTRDALDFRRKENSEYVY